MEIDVKYHGIIVLEGADGTGKTTLAQHLVDKHGAYYKHLGLVPKEKMLEYQTVALEEAVERSRESLVVLDRHWISDQIYGRVYRGEGSFSYAARGMDRVIQAYGGVYVMAVPTSTGSVIDRHRKLKAERYEEYEADHRFVKVAKGYHRFTYGGGRSQTVSDYVQAISNTALGFNGRLDVLTYHLLEDDMEAVAAAAVDTARHRLAVQRPFLDHGDGMLGHVDRAMYLICGDQPNNPKGSTSPRHRWPLYAGRSAEYLYRTFHQLRFDETEALWVNTLGSSNGCLIQDLMYTYGHYLRPIALGRLAAERLRSLGVTVAAELPHPSYWQRFEHHNLEGYVKLWRQALKKGR